MPLYDVLKKLDLKDRKEIKLPGDVVELDVRQGVFLAETHQAVRLRGSPVPVVAQQTSALTTAPARRVTRCCGR